MNSKFVTSVSMAVVICLLFSLAACSVSYHSIPNPQVEAIGDIRPILRLPDLPLEFVEETGMINSPTASWTVAAYRDSEGRKYFVEVEMNRVVEIDGRELLSKRATIVGALKPAELRELAERMAKEAFPDFSSLQTKLTHEEGQKGDYYFFTWRDMYSPLSFNRPFMQLAFIKNGELFAYYNTLSSR